MQEGACNGIVVKSGKDLVSAQDDGEGQIAARNTFGKAKEIRPDSSLFMGKEGAGAPTANGNFIADQVHFMAITDGARQTQLFRVVHDHAGRTLNQRLNDQCSDFLMMFAEILLKGCGRLSGDVNGRFSVLSLARIRSRQRGGRADQWRIGILEQGHVRYCHGSHSFAVLAPFQAEKAVFPAATKVAPAME